MITVLHTINPELQLAAPRFVSNPAKQSCRQAMALLSYLTLGLALWNPNPNPTNIGDMNEAVGRWDFTFPPPNPPHQQ